MEIKQIINKKVNSFTLTKFSCKGNSLEKILKLFQVEEVYVCFYSNKSLSLNTLQAILDSKLCQVKLPTKKHQEALIVKISTENCYILLDWLSDYEYDELIIWSCYTDWENFYKHLTNYKTNSASNVPSFFLSYNVYDGNTCEIICDIKFNESIKYITTEKLQDILV